MGVVVRYTDEDAITALVKHVKSSMRLGVMDNNLTPPTPDEIKLALQDSLMNINSFPPMTQYSFADIYNTAKLKQIVPLISMGAKHLLAQMLAVEAAANYIDVAIDDFAVSSKTNEYNNMAAIYKAQFDEELARKKPLLAMIVRGGARQTTTQFGATGWISANTSQRYYNSVLGGRVD